MSLNSSYPDQLNPRQRQAVEHGLLADGSHPAAPLLVIARAGLGKTNTLAHRVAHLIVKGADPRRILLLTFLRRAAAEMARRVERIAGQVLGQSAGVMTDALTWAGTFHGIGASLLRDYAPEIGLVSAFSIHDREDSADLMNLVRHELGFSTTQSRFPAKGTCLAIYSRCVNGLAHLDDGDDRAVLHECTPGPAQVIGLWHDGALLWLPPPTMMHCPRRVPIASQARGAGQCVRQAGSGECATRIRRRPASSGAS